MFCQKNGSDVEAYPLCDHCLGRQFALLGRGLENDRRGQALKLSNAAVTALRVCQKNSGHKNTQTSCN